MGLEDIGINMKISRLDGIRRDLSDDSYSINEINSTINNIIDNVEAFIQVGSSSITSKLNNLKEPYQSNDSNIINARAYLQYEINYLRQKRDEN